MKRIYLRKTGTEGNVDVKMKTETYYRSDDPSKKFISMAKRGKKFNRDARDRQDKPLVSHIKEEKKKYVKKLLTARFGEGWKNMDELIFLKECVSDLFTMEVMNESVMCDCLDEECVLEKL